MAEYAAVFFQRVVKNEYSEDDAENAKEAGKAFVGAPCATKTTSGRVPVRALTSMCLRWCF